MKNGKNIMTVGLVCLSLAMGFSRELMPTTKNETIGVRDVKTSVKKTKNNSVKIALLLDTSNSMDGLINQAKSQLWDIVNEFTHAKCDNDNRPLLQIAIYQYGNDALSSREGYIQQILNFSSDLDQISEKLFSLRTNGGEEYCGEVIQTSITQLDWGKNPDHLKMIFIAGNEPFTQGKLDYRDAVANAKEKDIVVNTIFCGRYEEGIHTDWKKGAVLTGGDYMTIDHNREVVHIKTPYDDSIMLLNRKLNKTYVSYGSLGSSKMQLQSAQDANALELEEAVAVKRAVSKSSRLYNNKNWDLVDAYEDKEFDITNIAKNELPEVLRNKSKKEIATYIESKKTERAEIQKEIQGLNTKRESYIATKTKNNSNGALENVMLNAIKKQAKMKNYRWE